MASARPIKVGLDPSVAPWAAEIKYVFRTLLRVAGYPYIFTWAGEGRDEASIDIYYGRPRENISESVSITACGEDFADTQALEPRELIERKSIPFLNFGQSEGSAYRQGAPGLSFANDIIFSCYWLLSGAREPYYSRDRWDNLYLDGSFFLKNSLASKPLVSVYGSLLRRHFQRLGYEPLDFPWSSDHTSAAFVFSHDVDYPQMIRWIECLRLVHTRGSKSVGSIWRVLRGTNHFWKFADWVEYEKKLGTRPAFYFMARQGSLLQYAMGTPDGFYDIRSPEFQQLFSYLRDEGCEVGLHASYNAYKDLQQLKQEKESLENAAGVRVDGNRHHRWRLNPTAPHETLYMHEQVGLKYDTSLAFEFYPGFRRGICHPFRPFHPGERRELNIVELPPVWMDDHFDRRLAQNTILDPQAHAQHLLDIAQATHGTIIVDYHLRGMNGDFFPRYGPWIVEFVDRYLDSYVTFRTPGEITAEYIEYEKQLEKYSVDQTITCTTGDLSKQACPRFEVGPLRPNEVSAVAELHFDLFKDENMHGYSAATLGCTFLERIFYGLTVDNPYFFCDIARYNSEVIGFCVFTTHRKKVFRYTLYKHFFGVAYDAIKLIRKKPGILAPLLKNLRYLRGERLPWAKSVDALWLVIGVHPKGRTKEFREQVGVHVGSELVDHMEITMREHGCHEWYGAVPINNFTANLFLQGKGAKIVSSGETQGLKVNYYLKTLDITGGDIKKGKA